VECLSIDVMVNVLVPVGDHRTSSIPALAPNNVHLAGQEGICRAHDRTDVEIVLEIFDRYMEGMPARIKLGHDRLELPVAEFIDNIASVACREQLFIQARVMRPRLRMWANSY
jgi:hypothetical protein